MTLLFVVHCASCWIKHCIIHLLHGIGVTLNTGDKTPQGGWGGGGEREETACENPVPEKNNVVDSAGKCHVVAHRLNGRTVSHT
jgi:hypothetical protein